MHVNYLSNILHFYLTDRYFTDAYSVISSFTNCNFFLQLIFQDKQLLTHLLVLTSILLQSGFSLLPCFLLSCINRFLSAQLFQHFFLLYHLLLADPIWLLCLAAFTLSMSFVVSSHPLQRDFFLTRAVVHLLLLIHASILQLRRSKEVMLD